MFDVFSSKFGSRESRLLTCLQLPPYILEVEQPLFANQPLGGAYRAFGESASGFGSMAKVDGVGGRIEDQFVHPDHVPLAKRSDFKLGSGGVLNDFLQCDGRSRRG